MSVSPRQKRSNPPPVPETPTVMSTPGLPPRKPSAAAVAYGATVLDPSIWIRPERPRVGAGAVVGGAAAVTAATGEEHRKREQGETPHRGQCSRPSPRRGSQGRERLVTFW